MKKTACDLVALSALCLVEQMVIEKVVEKVHDMAEPTGEEMVVSLGTK